MASAKKIANDLLEIVKTNDGSFTLFHPTIGEHYHSVYGALQESQHVFLQAGLQYYLNQTGQASVSVLEVGFGTGLNFLVTAEYCKKIGIRLLYNGIERYPLSTDLMESMHHQDHFIPDLTKGFYATYNSAFNQEIEVLPNILLKLVVENVCSFQSQQLFDVLYFDAFAAAHQPEMWTTETLSHISGFLKSGGVFVTYAITGNLKRTMKSLGFKIEKVVGAAGKREMLRAVKD